MNDSIICILLAFIGGIVSMLSSNVIAYPAFLAKLNDRKYHVWVERVLLVFSILFSLGSVGIFVLATGFGPVSIAMPIMNGTTLFTNMLFQNVVGMKIYTKPMMMGTLVLVCAISCLIDVGPTVQKYENVIALVSTVQSIVYISLLVLLMIGSVLVLYAKETSSGMRVFLYALVVSSSNVIDASVGKLFQSTSGIAFYIMVILYFILGAINVFYSAKAPFNVDLSVYMPVMYCLNLSLNCVMGFIIWEDGRVITSWIAYIMVYVLILCGVYLCASVDIGIQHYLASYVTGKISLGVISNEFAKDADILLRLWRTKGDNESSIAALRRVMETGVETSRVQPNELVELIMRFYKAMGPSSIPIIVEWMNSDWKYYLAYAKFDPGLKRILEDLSDELGTSTAPNVIFHNESHDIPSEDSQRYNNLLSGATNEDYWSRPSKQSYDADIESPTGILANLLVDKPVNIHMNELKHSI